MDFTRFNSVELSVCALSPKVGYPLPLLCKLAELTLLSPLELKPTVMVVKVS
jgi:hypothetical protein